MGALSGAAFRFSLAALVLIAAMLGFRVPLPKGKVQWEMTVLIGLLEFAASYGLVYWGEQSLDSGLAAVLFAILPFLTAIMGYLFVGEEFTARHLAGIVIGFIGLLVVFGGSLSFDVSKGVPMLSIVLSALLAAIVLIVIKRWGKGLHPATYTTPAMAIGAIVLGVVAGLAGERLDPPQGVTAWASLVYTALFSSVGAFLVYFWLVQRWGPGRTSLTHLITPVVALALGVVLLGERPGLEALLGASVVLLGILITISAPLSRAEVGQIVPPDMQLQRTRHFMRK